MAHSFDLDGVFSAALLGVPLLAVAAFAWLPETEPTVVGLAFHPAGRLVLPVGRNEAPHDFGRTGKRDLPLWRTFRVLRGDADRPHLLPVAPVRDDADPLSIVAWRHT